MSDSKVSFLDLMHAWRDDFNASRQDIEVEFEIFTGIYQCIKVGKKGSKKRECAAHLYYQNGDHAIEIDYQTLDGPEFIHAEDPSFFDRLVARLEEKVNDMEM